MLWGMSNPRGAAGRGAASSTGATTRRCGSGSPSLLPATAELGLRRGLGRHHRLHARPPADPGSPFTDGRAGGGTTVAAAGGHGMMWGPGVVARRADLGAARTTDVVDVDRPRAWTGSTSTAAASSPPTRSRCPSRPAAKPGSVEGHRLCDPGAARWRRCRRSKDGPVFRRDGALPSHPSGAARYGARPRIQARVRRYPTRRGRRRRPRPWACRSAG